MATISEKDKIFKLSQAEYNTLSSTGTLTKDGVTYTYSPSDTIYVTPDDSIHEYSSTEQIVGYWVNGKPIYEKTVPFTLDNDGFWISHADGGENELFPSVAQCIDIKGFLNTSNVASNLGTIMLNANFREGTNVNAASTIRAYFITDPTDPDCYGLLIETFKGSSGIEVYANQSGYATVQYTKSTD
jgi:hypothetical protein